MLRDLAELYGAVAEEHGLALELTVTGSLPTLGDRDLIQQALTNLLDNAVKYSPPGGAVRLTGIRKGGLLRLAVRDQGPGIPAGDVERATERFFRGESARATPGFGLGLTLVRAVAQLHGGSLILDSSESGLDAVLTLPLAPAPSEPAVAETSGARQAFPAPGQHQDVAMGRPAGI